MDDPALEVTAPSLGDTRSEKIQEEGSDMDFEKLFIGFLAARVKRWNLGIAQSENVRHTGCIWRDDTESTPLYSFQTLTLETVVSTY